MGDINFTVGEATRVKVAVATFGVDVEVMVWVELGEEVGVDDGFRVTGGNLLVADGSCGGSEVDVTVKVAVLRGRVGTV